MVTRRGRTGPGHQHGADDEVGVEELALDRVGAGRDGADAAAERGVRLAQPRHRQVEHRDVGAHADRDLGRVPPDDPAAEHDDLGGVDAGHPAEQQTPAPPSFFIRW